MSLNPKATEEIGNILKQLFEAHTELSKENTEDNDGTEIHIFAVKRAKDSESDESEQITCNSNLSTEDKVTLFQTFIIQLHQLIEHCQQNTERFPKLLDLATTGSKHAKSKLLELHEENIKLLSAMEDLCTIQGIFTNAELEKLIEANYSEESEESNEPESEEEIKYTFADIKPNNILNNHKIVSLDLNNEGKTTVTFLDPEGNKLRTTPDQLLETLNQSKTN